MNGNAENGEIRVVRVGVCVGSVVGWGGKNEGWGINWAGTTGSFTIIELITMLQQSYR